MTTNNFSEVIDSLFSGLDGFISTKTVVGEPIEVKDTIIVPLMDVSMGLGAGAGVKDDKKNSGTGGMGAKMSPSAVLIIKDGTTRMVNIKSQDAVNKVLDMVPDLLDRFVPSKKESDPDVEAAIRQAAGREE